MADSHAAGLTFERCAGDRQRGRASAAISARSCAGTSAGDGDQAAALEIAALAPGLGIFGDELAQARDRVQMRALDVDVERAGAGIVEAGDRLVGRRDAARAGCRAPCRSFSSRKE